ncbi:MAG: DUF3261 domain-containing protein [Treponema sp.]|nr:DUF3261 domain-containing protein [Treponema sp.]
MKRLIFLTAVLALAYIGLISCGSTKNVAAADSSRAKLNPVYVTDKAQFNLLPTTAVEKNFDAVQHFKATFGEKEFESDVLLIADSEKLVMTILNNFGATMGELNYNNDLVVFNSDLFPKALKAEYIVADVQFCLYRVDALAKAMEDIGLKLVVSIADKIDGNSVETRSIFEGEKEIAHIEKSIGKITYTNFLREYSYTLQGTF